MEEIKDNDKAFLFLDPPYHHFHWADFTMEDFKIKHGSAFLIILKTANVNILW
jgi:site-specific DNA-adenine methylase